MNKELDEKQAKTQESLDDLQQVLANQKQAYEVLLDTIKDKEATEQVTLQQKKDLEGQFSSLQDLNKQQS